MPSRLFSIGMADQLGLPRHLMFQAPHQGWPRRQVHPALTVQHGGDRLLGLLLHPVDIRRNELLAFDIEQFTQELLHLSDRA